MTIARDRWQQHLKSARRLLPRRGARAATRCTRATPTSARTSPPWPATRWPSVLEACRVGRLTRNQHVLLRLGELDRRRRVRGAPRRPGRGGRRRRRSRPKADAASMPRGPRRDQPGVRPRRRASRWPTKGCAGSAGARPAGTDARQRSTPGSRSTRSARPSPGCSPTWTPSPTPSTGGRSRPRHRSTS